jgi:hypothetical protein
MYVFTSTIIFIEVVSGDRQALCRGVSGAFSSRDTFTLQNNNNNNNNNKIKKNWADAEA